MLKQDVLKLGKMNPNINIFHGKIIQKFYQQKKNFQLSLLILISIYHLIHQVRKVKRKK